MINGAPAIRFPLPREILMHNRREHARLKPMAPLSLRCVADEGGFAPFESRVVDVSHDGLGMLIYDPNINLAEGTVLHNSRIVIPSGDAVISDMELRHITTVRMPDGTMAHRAGFRFMRKNGELAKLVQLFIQDMDKK